MTRAAFNTVVTKPLASSGGLTRRSLLRSTLAGLAAGAIACPQVARAQVPPNFVPTTANSPVSDYWPRAPRNVVYYNNASVPLATIADGNFPYTDIIIGFLIPDPASNYTTLTGQGGGFDPPDYSQTKSDIQRLRAQGINVLLSVGGQINFGWTSALYKQSSGNYPALALQIANFVRTLGASGVDIDYEDDAGLDGNIAWDGTKWVTTGSSAGYDGLGFLTNLTIALAQSLPGNGNIITHAPPAPFWDKNTQWHAAYYYLNQNAGNYIAWYNTQFYGDPGYDESAGEKVTLYNTFAQEIGPTKLIMGFTNDQMTVGNISGSDMLNAIAQVQAANGAGGSLPEFGGVMTFELSNDPSGNAARGIWQALTPETAAGPGKYIALPY